MVILTMHAARISARVIMAKLLIQRCTRYFIGERRPRIIVHETMVDMIGFKEKSQGRCGYLVG